MAEPGKRSFPPVVNGDTRLLILGSLPGDASLAAAQYYAYPQNKFWELVGAVIDVDLRALSYEQRLQTLLRHGIGLWDVIAQAERKGSLDAAIRKETRNDLRELIESLPKLRMIAFNGATAAKHGLKSLDSHAARCRIVRLPSSSPAHTLKFEQKRLEWAVLTSALDMPADAHGVLD
ncbi:DNA-deoxyinosine glycosylase [Chromobacterium alticapitis]|uniref:DNA-deoxyinosine glycosylase n=1 Tax=Chromobacterium alticapitis TaxID=2073169 RepID=A0A2S5DFQ2_9NEIS|nr:DNA-deoxyinosine glycosylase [Chromobacterium alticapitis]POZ61818.1 DNA-deoxyinosine glycosylase [Chromobacterium alticapitis]